MSGRRRRANKAVGAAVAALFVAGVGAAAAARPTPDAGTAPDRELTSPLRPVVAEPAPAPAAAPPSEAPAPVAPPAAPPPDGPAEPVVEAAMAPPPEVFDAPPAPPPPPPAVLVDAHVRPLTAPSGGTWAVVIGINDYPGTGSDLRSAVNDASDVDLALAGMGVPAENRLVLLDGAATGERIRQSVDWLVRQADAGATAVFFYGGHVRKLGLVTEAIVAADGSLIDDRELGERFSHLRAGRAWIAMASCYGGGFTELLAPGRVLTGAAPADALAYESSEYGRSYLVQSMVREAMIERRAPGSVQAAFAYAVAELARRHPTRVPVQIDAGPGPLDLRPVVGSTIPAAPPAPAPPPTPPTTPPCRQLLLFGCR